MFDFIKDVIGLTLFERAVPGTATFLNWIFLFPLAILSFGGIAFCFFVFSFDMGYNLPNFMLCLGFVGLPIGLLAVASNS